MQEAKAERSPQPLLPLETPPVWSRCLVFGPEASSLFPAQFIPLIFYFFIICLVFVDLCADCANVRVRRRDRAQGYSRDRTLSKPSGNSLVWETKTIYRWESPVLASSPWRTRPSPRSERHLQVHTTESWRDATTASSPMVALLFKCLMSQISPRLKSL